SSVAVERDAQVADLQQDADDIQAIGRKLLRRRFFGDHPLAVDANGTVDEVGALRGSDLRTLHRRLFVAPNMVLSVAGDFSPRALAPRLRALLRRLPRREAPTPRTAAPGPAEVADIVEKLPRQQAVVFQG